MATSLSETAPPPRKVRGFGWYSSATDAPTSRRPADAVLLALSLLGLALLSPAAPGPTDVDTEVMTAVGSIPGWFSWLLAAANALATAWALVLLLVPLAHRGRRRIAGEAAGAALLAVGLAMMIGALTGSGGAETWSSMWLAGPPPVHGAARVATVTAIIIAASPHISHPLRLVGRVAVALAAVAAVGVGTSYLIGALAGLLCGAAAGAVVHLIAGSPAGRPTPQRVAAALEELGLPDAEVTSTDNKVADGTEFAATVPDRPPLLVTVLGRDEVAARTISAAWVAATTRGERLSLTSTRLSRVEHAAMTSLLAERAGARVLPVIAVGRSTEGDALLVSQAPSGPRLADLPADQVSDDLLAAYWQQLDILHTAGIAHGRVDGTRLLTDASGDPVLSDLLGASSTPDQRDLHVDEIRMLVATALATNPKRAVAAAVGTLGSGGMTDLLPYLQPAVLDRSTRRAIADRDWTLGDLRAAAVQAAGVEPPPLAQIRRVGAQGAVKAAVGVLLTYGLVSAFSGVDFSEVWDTLSGADWRLLLVALVVSQVAPVFYTFGTMSATTTRLRYGPVLLLQYALQFIALALPATAARVAMDVRFFQSFGISAGASMSIGVIDSFSGFVVQVLLLLVILLSGLPAFTQPVSSSGDGSDADSSDPSLLALTLVIGLASLAVSLLVPHLRRRVLTRVRTARAAVVEQARNAGGALTVLRRPSKVMGMLGGNLGGQVIQAAALGVCLAAFGYDATMSQLILINTAVSLFAGLMPVPGGIGVAEAGYTAGLQAIGVPAPIALSTAIAFRLVTFYLPPLWGAFALRWLRRHSYA